MDPEELQIKEIRISLQLRMAKEKLTEEQVNVCFFKGTEPPFSGKYTNNKKKGMYSCVVCGTPLFHSGQKFESGTGWPSFDDPVDPKNIKTEDDFSMGMHRIEVQCAKCGSHLGHVFPDGPLRQVNTLEQQGKPAVRGQRYCVNSLALDFTEE